MVRGKNSACGFNKHVASSHQSVEKRGRRVLHMAMNGHPTNHKSDA